MEVSDIGASRYMSYRWTIRSRTWSLTDISANGPIPISVRISGPNWAFGFIQAIHRYLDHLIHGVNGPNGPGSFILLNRYIGKWTESDIDVGIPLRRFLVRHVIVVLG